MAAALIRRSGGLPRFRADQIANRSDVQILFCAKPLNLLQPLDLLGRVRSVTAPSPGWAGQSLMFPNPQSRTTDIGNLGNL
jgi:hypothetical protein